MSIIKRATLAQINSEIELIKEAISDAKDAANFSPTVNAVRYQLSRIKDQQKELVKLQIEKGIAKKFLED